MESEGPIGELFTGKLREGTPVLVAVLLDVGDEDLIFVRSPGTLLQTHLVTARSSHHLQLLGPPPSLFAPLTSSLYPFHSPSAECSEERLYLDIDGSARLRVRSKREGYLSWRCSTCFDKSKPRRNYSNRKGTSKKERAPTLSLSLKI